MREKEQSSAEAGLPKCPWPWLAWAGGFEIAMAAGIESRALVCLRMKRIDKKRRPNDGTRRGLFYAT